MTLQTLTGQAATATPPPPGPVEPEDPRVEPLTGEDLIGDLDPGWLAWRQEQTAK